MLISRFFTKTLVSDKKKRSIFENILSKIVLVLFVIILFFYYFFLDLNNNFRPLKFNFLNKILINNGFIIQNIKITGTNYLNQDDILKVIRTYNHVNIFSINLEKIYKEIKRNSWVKEGYIKIEYPDTIKIFITEKKPIAIWQNKNRYNLVTKKGEVILENNLNRFKNNLPIIIGSNAHKSVSAILKILNTNQKLSKNIWSLTFINERRWDLHFKQGLTIRLPSKKVEKAWQKITSLDKTYNILNLDLTEIDLRNSEQILGKINIDKKLIFKKKNS